MAIVGALGLVWWLMAAATGPAAYAYFMSWATSWVGYVVMIGLTWAFFEHMLSGMRHFVLDIGAGYELKVNKSWSILLPIVALFITGAVWACIFARGL